MCIALRMSTGICRLGEGYKWCPLQNGLSVGKPFPLKTTKMLSTRNSSMFITSFSVYLLFESACFWDEIGTFAT